MLSLPHVYSVIAYYLANRTAVDEYVAERTAVSGAARPAAEARFDPIGLRARLLARQLMTDAKA